MAGLVRFELGATGVDYTVRQVESEPMGEDRHRNYGIAVRVAVSDEREYEIAGSLHTPHMRVSDGSQERDADFTALAYDVHDPARPKSVQTVMPEHAGIGGGWGETRLEVFAAMIAAAELHHFVSPQPGYEEYLNGKAGQE